MRSKYSLDSNVVSLFCLPVALNVPLIKLVYSLRELVIIHNEKYI